MPRRHPEVVYVPARDAGVRRARPADLGAVLDLRRRECEAVGFLPRPRVEALAAVGSVWEVLENGEAAGFVTHAPLLNHPAQWVIWQAAVATDARRRAHGLRAVREVLAAARCHGARCVTAKCAADLASNAFWAAAGFWPLGYAPEIGRRGRPRIVWRRAVDSQDVGALDLPVIGRGRGGGRELLAPIDPEALLRRLTA